MKWLAKRSPMILIFSAMLMTVAALGLSGIIRANLTRTLPSLKSISTANYHSNPAPSRGNLQRTGVFQNVGTPKLDKVLWATETENFIDAVTVSGDLAYYIVPGYGLHALDIATGKVKWIIKDVNSLPTVQGDVVYYTYKDTLRAIEANTQKEKWVFQPGSHGLSSLLIIDNVGYLGDFESHFYALDLGTGQPKWSSMLSGASGGAVFSAGVPVVLDDKVYFGASNGYVYALDANSGKEIWSLKIADFVLGGPSVGDGLLYFLAGFDRTQADLIMSQDNIYAVEMEKGRLVWQFEPPHVAEMPGSVGPPIVGEGIVYCASSYDAWLGLGYIYAFDGATGRELWKHTTADQLWNPKDLAFYNGLLYVSARQPPDDRTQDAPMYVLDAKTGNEKWTFRAGGAVTEPAIADGALYIGSTGRVTDEGTMKSILHTLDPVSGKELRSIAISGGIAPSPLIVDGVVYLVTRDYTGSGDFVVAIH